MIIIKKGLKVEASVTMMTNRGRPKDRKAGFFEKRKGYTEAGK